ncbi:MAG: hypothetical protein ABJH68_11415 [Ilumatobacter sp.]|uniref:hypothetical protein n=1 Tax=Ilumatobacter sp. TaxID=1967498 RepID=UPI003299CA17
MSARAVGYSITAGRVTLFGFMLIVVIRLAASSSSAGIWLWAAAWAGIPLMATIALTVYIWRQPHTGGYALLGVASLIGSFFCMMAVLPFAVF